MFKLIGNRHKTVDIYGEFLNLYAQNKSLAGYYEDTYHINTGVGAKFAVDKIAKVLETANLTSNYVPPKLKGDIEYYPANLSYATGAWVLKNEASKPYTNPQGSLYGEMGNCVDISLVSSTNGNSITFPNISGELLYVFFTCGAGYGSINVIVNEGAGNAITTSYDTADSIAGFRSYFVCKLPRGNNSVKIVVTSTGKEVHINGILKV
jgi:hypothetical protein